MLISVFVLLPYFGFQSSRESVYGGIVDGRIAPRGEAMSKELKVTLEYCLQ
jgi:hypothetical protein